jgi:hypothetical protein
MGNRQACKKKARSLSVLRLEGYHGEVFVAGLDRFGSGLPEYPEKIGIYKLPYREAVIIQNPSIYQVDERGCCKDFAMESGHDPYP